MNLLIGCPVYKRDWILPAYFDHIEAACYNIGVEPSYCFLMAYEDEETIDSIQSRARPLIAVFVNQEPISEKRHWGPDRYRQMVTYRNTLLETVRREDPDFFLSLDSDILVHPQSLKNLFASVLDYDAVGGKAYLSPRNRAVPNWGNIGREGMLHRADADGVFRVDVLMAMKLMTRQAYRVDYEYHECGEDIGWSLNCARNGLKLGWDGRITNKHVMGHQQLQVVDPRCGY